MSRAFDGVEVRICLCSSGVGVRVGARVGHTSATNGRVLEGGAVKAGPSGPPAGEALRAPVVRFVASHHGVADRRRRSLVAKGGGAPRTPPLTQELGRAPWGSAAPPCLRSAGG